MRMEIPDAQSAPSSCSVAGMPIAKLAPGRLVPGACASAEEPRMAKAAASEAAISAVMATKRLMLFELLGWGIGNHLLPGRVSVNPWTPNIF